MLNNQILTIPRKIKKTFKKLNLMTKKLFHNILSSESDQSQRDPGEIEGEEGEREEDC